MKRAIRVILFSVIVLSICGIFGIIIYYNSQDHTSKPSYNTITSTSTKNSTNPTVIRIDVEGLKREVKQNEAYSFDNVEVYAILSTGRENVTNKVTFPKVDTSKPGKTKIVISYKDVKKEVEINVLAADQANKLKYIEIDSSNVKKNYKINEELSLDDLIVYGVYTDNSRQAISDYSYNMKDESGNEITALDKAGSYTIYISYNGCIDQFEIKVTDENELTPSVKIIDNKAHLNLQV